MAKIPKPKQKPKTLYPKKKVQIKTNEILMIQGTIIIFLLIIIAFALQKPYVIVV